MLRPYTQPLLIKFGCLLSIGEGESEFQASILKTEEIFRYLGDDLGET